MPVKPRTAKGSRRQSHRSDERLRHARDELSLGRRMVAAVDDPRDHGRDDVGAGERASGEASRTSSLETNGLRSSNDEADHRRCSSWYHAINLAVGDDLAGIVRTR